jgi:uracil phosphoribosyltransferase
VEIKTPLETTIQSQIKNHIIIAPILRAGLSMVDPFIRLWPDTQVFHIGMRRNEETHIAETYYNNIQSYSSEKPCDVFILDPMLATGGSIDDACNYFKEKG